MKSAKNINFHDLWLRVLEKPDTLHIVQKIKKSKYTKVGGRNSNTQNFKIWLPASWRQLHILKV